MKSFQVQTHYELLEVSVGASHGDIRSAFERLMRLYSNDQVALYGLVDDDSAEALRAKLKEAAAVLLDDARRATYDASIGLPPREVPVVTVPRPSAPASGGWASSYTFVSPAPSAPLPPQPTGYSYTVAAPPPVARPSAPASSSSQPAPSSSQALEPAAPRPSAPTAPAASQGAPVPSSARSTPEPNSAPSAGSGLDAGGAPDVAVPSRLEPALGVSPSSPVSAAVAAPATSQAGLSPNDVSAAPPSAAPPSTQSEANAALTAPLASSDLDPTPNVSQSAPASAGPAVSSQAPVAASPIESTSVGPPAAALSGVPTASPGAGEPGSSPPAAFTASAGPLADAAREPQPSPSNTTPSPPQHPAPEQPTETSTKAEPTAASPRVDASKPDEQPNDREETAIVATRAPPREYRPPERPKPYEVPSGVEFNGDLLRQVRMARGLSLLQLSERTRIGVRHLENIEGDRYDQLPALVYLRGMLTNLARELGLDGVRVSKSYLAFVEAHLAKAKG